MFCLLLQLVLHALVLAAQESDFKVLPGKHNFKSKFTVIKTAKKDNFIYDIKYCPKDNVDLFNEIDNELNFYQVL